MFSKRLHISVPTDFANSPDVTCGNCCYTVEHVPRIARSALLGRARTRTWDHAPLAAVPMLNGSELAAVRGVVVADGPNVGIRDCSHAIKEVCAPGIRTGNDEPP